MIPEYFFFQGAVSKLMFSCFIISCLLFRLIPLSGAKMDYSEVMYENVLFSSKTGITLKYFYGVFFA